MDPKAKIYSVRGRDVFSILILVAAPVIIITGIFLLFRPNATMNYGMWEGFYYSGWFGNLWDGLYGIAIVIYAIYLLAGKQLEFSESSIGILGPYSGPVKKKEGLSYYVILAPRKLDIPWDDIQSMSLEKHFRSMGKGSIDSRFMIFHLKNGDYYSIGINFLGIGSIKRALKGVRKEDVFTEVAD